MYVIRELWTRMEREVERARPGESDRKGTSVVDSQASRFKIRKPGQYTNYLTVMTGLRVYASGA